MQVIGNPLNYPIRDVVKKGSKYLINFLQVKWKNDQNESETIQFDNNYASNNTVMKVDSKIIKAGKKKSTNIVIIYYYIMSIRLYSKKIIKLNKYF